MTQKQVWIDTDLSAGMRQRTGEGYCDVDDAFAIAQLIKAESVNIAGISAVFGNTSIENSFPLCRKMSAEFSNNTIPVYKGAARALELNSIQSNDAVEALAEALHRKKLSILAIGPATNIGILLLKYPELKSQIEEVVLVAGRGKASDHFGIGNKGNCAPDLNFDMDNHAFQVLFESGLNIVLCPFEVSSKVWIEECDLKALAKGDACNQWLAEVAENWLAQWKNLGAKGFNPFDVLASHYLIDPEAIISEKRQAHLEIHPDDTLDKGIDNSFKQHLVCDDSPGFELRYCFDVKAGFHKKLMASFAVNS